MSFFRLEAKSGHARAGVITTLHGEVPTPAFMPVATQATVKALSGDDVLATGARMVIMNTYHLWLRPGPDIIAEHGGLHGFSRFGGSIATDSGGFQAFSLSDRVNVSEQGFEFSSHLDGQRLLLTPELAMQIQSKLGSDIAMQLDVCSPGGASREELAAAIARTTRWAERCLAAKAERQALFGIVQGGTDTELRLRHAEELGALPFDGIALGGFSVGEPNDSMHRTLSEVAHRLPPDRPRYLMGVGTPRDLLLAIGAGVDVFDCVMPTRNARNGQAFVPGGKVVIKNARHRDAREPLDENCPCAACRAGVSRSYLRHLHLAGEMLAARLLTLHNLTFYARLVADARTAIAAGRYAEFSAEHVGPARDADLSDEQ